MTRPTKYHGLSKVKPHIACAVLASWVLWIAVCSWNVFGLHVGQEHHSYGTTSAHADQHADHSGSQDDACCTVLEDLPAFPHVSNINVSEKNLAYALPSYIVQLFQVIALISVVLMFTTDPPGIPRHLLITSTARANAPPR